MAATEELFCKPVFICMKSADREDRRAHIRVTVELSTVTNPVHKKELVVRLTDDSDLFFLFNLALGEEDFQMLKSQQGLLVDFGAFPQKFIDLLELCLQEEQKENPKFLLQFVSGSGSDRGCAHLNIVETNPFKHLTHLALRFAPGNDTDVKKYLAVCLKNLKEERSALQHKLESTEAELSQRLRNTQDALSSKSVELDKLKSELQTTTSSLTNKHVQEVTSEREKALKVQTDLQQQIDHTRRELEQTHRQASRQMEARVNELETVNKDLTDRRYRAESTIRDLKSKLAGLEEESHRAKQEVQSLRRENGSLDSECHEKDKRLSQLKTRVAVLEQEVKDKEEVGERTNQLMETTHEQKRRLEESLEQKQVQIAKMETTIKSMSEEILKGNEIIKRLQGDLKGYMSKMKLKNAVTTKQEKVLTEKERDLERASQELKTAREHLKQKEEENRKLNETLESTMEKLEESKQLLKTNENVIQWLNKQVTESQLQAQNRHGTFEMPSAISSANSFKPPMGLHNYSTPVSTVSTLSADSQPMAFRPPLVPINHQAQIQYNPHGATRRSVTPTERMRKSVSPTIPPIPEEITPSPGSRSASPAATQGAPALDPKYLQRREDTIPVRGLSRNSPPPNLQETVNTHPKENVPQLSRHNGQNIGPPKGQVAMATQNIRLSKASIVPQAPLRPKMPAQPPLMSAYFPGKVMS
ncbi:spindle assembly abnormal protein 6 homolog [Branchiostoma lanceolatum]|uniref:spindle assembly abnormal protein 6 homolog n=1 Tax=Branchiostoma lanceolatum TaxID=7740 RepID=UPI003451F152